jgi:hypothetical protein
VQEVHVKNVIATLLLVAGTGSGCVLLRVDPPGSSFEEKKCPPGHRWSDGGCHDKGKGHDPNKETGKP